ncbi:unnamed protein product [marine sediment metagenome]|uniref:Uncharacterized protein n=1 Tax=marine sediment metagenome TaxID=412755 RepID=X1BTT3_9ZZZZ
MFLVAEYCRGPFYMGWHLYLRENRVFMQNLDGGWGWIRRVCEDSTVMALLSSIGITISGDGTCDDGGIAELARQYPVKGRRCGGKLRGCIEVEVGEFGKIEVANKAIHRTPKGAGD